MSKNVMTVSNSSISKQVDFLNDIQKEFEEGGESREPVTEADSEDESAEEIYQYNSNLFLKEITSAKKILARIKTEKEKGITQDKKILQKLVNRFNKKKEELTQLYKFLRHKKNADNSTETYLNKSNTIAISSKDTLNYQGKGKNFKQGDKKSEADELEFVEFTNEPAISSSVRPNNSNLFDRVEERH